MADLDSGTANTLTVERSTMTDEQDTLEQLIDRELPARLRATAIYSACGLTQQQSAILQSVSDRTVRSRLTEIRDLLCPQSDVCAIVCEALQTCLDKPRKSQSLLALLAG